LFLAHLNNTPAELGGLRVKPLRQHSLLQLLCADGLVFNAELLEELLEAGSQDGLVFPADAQDFIGQRQVLALVLGYRFDWPRPSLAAQLSFAMRRRCHCLLLCVIRTSRRNSAIVPNDLTTEANDAAISDFETAEFGLGISDLKAGR